MTATTPRLVARIDGMRPRSDADGQNARGSYWRKARRSKLWTEVVALELARAGWPRQLPWPKAVCTITTVAARGKEPDDDNAAGCAKSCRDAVARWFRVDDGPQGPITWRYRWSRGPDATEIAVEEAEG